MTLGIPREAFSHLKARFGCDLELVRRLAIERFDTALVTDLWILIEGPLLSNLQKALETFKFWREQIAERDGLGDIKEAVKGLTESLNTRHGKGWEYFYTERPASEPIRNGLAGARFMFRRKRPLANSNA